MTPQLQSSGSPSQTQANFEETPVPRIRLMTCNIRKSLGANSRREHWRIASIIERYQPDIVSLQDVAGSDEGSEQASALARQTCRSFHFSGIRTDSEGSFGHAVLTAWPFELFSGYGRRSSKGDPPVANGVRVMVPNGGFELVNANLSSHLLRQLMGTQYSKPNRTPAAAEKARAPASNNACVVLCGDFAADSWSRRNRKSPTFRLNHLWVGASFSVVASFVPCDPLVRRAFDQLPLFADLVPTRKRRFNTGVYRNPGTCDSASHASVGCPQA